MDCKINGLKKIVFRVEIFFMDESAFRVRKVNKIKGLKIFPNLLILLMFQKKFRPKDPFKIELLQ